MEHFPALKLRFTNDDKVHGVCEFRVCEQGFILINGCHFKINYLYIVCRITKPQV